jgi:ribosomal protein S18 acetylase RimI-like enzyme
MGMKESIIRQMKLEDVPYIIRIDEKIVGHPNEAKYRDKIPGYIGRCPEACLVAEIEGEIVGFILGDIRGWDFGIPLSGWIEIVGVAPHWQEKGIGKKLTQVFLEYCKDNGVESVQTMVNWNDGDLIDYFRALGFKRGEYLNLQKKLN